MPRDHWLYMISVPNNYSAIVQFGYAGRNMREDLWRRKDVGQRCYRERKMDGRVSVPAGVKEIRIRPHDLVSGYGPATVALPPEETGTGDLYEVIR